MEWNRPFMRLDVAGLLCMGKGDEKITVPVSQDGMRLAIHEAKRTERGYVMFLCIIVRIPLIEDFFFGFV